MMSHHHQNWIINLIQCLNVRFLFLGHQLGAADRSGGLRGVHLQVLREQRPGRFPHHHAGVCVQHPPAAAETGGFPPRPQAGLAAAPPDWDSRAAPRHPKGPGQKLCAHVASLRTLVCVYEIKLKVDFSRWLHCIVDDKAETGAPSCGALWRTVFSKAPLVVFFVFSWWKATVLTKAAFLWRF